MWQWLRNPDVRLGLYILNIFGNLRELAMLRNRVRGRQAQALLLGYRNEAPVAADAAAGAGQVQGEL